MITNYTNQVKEIISNHTSGWVFTHVDFNAVGSMASVERVLSRLVVSGEIKRIRRGIYYIHRLRVENFAIDIKKF